MGVCSDAQLQWGGADVRYTPRLIIPSLSLSERQLTQAEASLNPGCTAESFSRPLQRVSFGPKKPSATSDAGQKKSYRVSSDPSSARKVITRTVSRGPDVPWLSSSFAADSPRTRFAPTPCVCLEPRSSGKRSRATKPFYALISIVCPLIRTFFRIGQLRRGPI